MVTFTVPGRLDGLNRYTDANRSDPRAGARAKRANQRRVEEAIRLAGLRPVEGPVEVAISWVEGRKRNGALRDPDNIRSAAKFVLDALVSCGVIPDDGPGVVRRIHDSYEYGSDDPHVTVAVMPYEPHRTVTHGPVRGID